MVIHSDLTDIKRHEKEVVDREVRLAGLLSVTPDAIIAIGGDIKIRVFNPGAEKLFGYNAADMMGQPLDLLMPARFQIAHADHIKRFLASPEQSRSMTERGEIIGVKADGSEFLAEASVSKLQLDDETILTVMLHDVTERKRAEADLIAAKEQAEHALIQAEKMAAIGTLTSGIGHEINNPLYAILGAAEAIRDGEDLSRCREHGQDIITYCKHISEIIKNLSGYIHPAEKHGLEPVDVNETISEAISMARLSPLTQDIEIIERLHPVAEISAKSEDVQQAFFNIIRNGLQAIGRKGTLEVDTGQEGKFVSVRIRDTGAGIAPNDLAKIFDPFFTTKGPDEGEGIGLFVVQQIVKKYDGTIDFESELGKGTLCTIEFPVRGTSEGTV
jgi:PAS domain S-box-containing protein